MKARLLKWCTAGVALFCLPVLAEELLVGFGPHRPPYVFENEPQGLEYELFVAAASASGFDVKAHYGPTPRLALMFNQQKLSAMSSMFLSGQLHGHFTEPYVTYQDMAVALAKRNLEIKTVADLERYSVSSFKDARRLLGDEFATMVQRNPAYREEPRQINRNLLLYGERIDVVVGDPLIIQFFNPHIAKQVDTRQPLRWYPLFQPINFQAVFHTKQQRDRFNAGLAAIRSNGLYQRIEQRYRSASLN
ncbi:substrate-binding periplasmic protein [Atopomonas sediminilitoris]|uniref:substrate-binding periplasmic protein n=1 Tax=Atopomonas sediminilitoris TaxID=2919919 RepID=UPI001F4D63C2|nr:transporter substrate-binding domain-containing protein [Atopomonas sediminilitoris]MCJ8169276.1 transporter substrate-binding domain-containing protein [Atopomonas sediminilitoris]